MRDDEASGARGGLSTRSMEIAVALVLLALGALVVVDSWRLGARWGDDGPQSGYFPFYIGLLLCVSSIATLAHVAFSRRKRGDASRGATAEDASLFVQWSQLRLVASVLIPAVIYVLAVQFIGLYVASVVYIAAFMRWLGKYSWSRSALVGVVTSATIFVLFEIWFKVPLYKGIWDPLAFTGY